MTRPGLTFHVATGSWFRDLTNIPGLVSPNIHELERRKPPFYSWVNHHFLWENHGKIMGKC